MKRILAIVYLFSAMLIVSPAASQENATGVRKIAVVKIKSLVQFNSAQEGLKKGMAAAQIRCQITEYDLSEGNPKTAERIRQISPDLIVPIGSTAARFARDYFPDIPVVFAMVLYPSLSGITSLESSKITGASMDIPIQKQFETVREVIPRTRKIGVLYDPNETAELVKEARKVAEEMGMELVAIEVRFSKDVPAALEGIERKVDVLWSVADGTVFSPKMTEYIISYTLQHNLPFMGLSPEFVEAGAPFALSQDFEDIGRQAADSVVRILAGADPKDIQITVPRKILLVLNLRTANEIGVKIPDRVIEKAARVIR